MLFYEVESQLKLQLFDVSDAKALFALSDANREHLNPWMPWIATTKEVADSEKFIRMARQQFADREGLPLGIFYAGAVAGTIGCNKFNWQDKSTEIGYWLGQSYTGKGIITKSCRAIIDHCFNTLKLNRIVIRADVANAPSRAVPERLGFTLEGIARQAGCIDEKYHDLAIYSLLAAEWQAA